MAYFTKTSKGWRVQIERKGVRKSQTFATKAAGQAWAAEQERAILDGEQRAWPRKTVQQAMERYADEITPGKGSAKAEALRLAAFVRDYPDLARKYISDITPADIARWRDDQLKRITPGSVKRAANSLRAVWTLAAKEWEWCGASPWSSVTMPQDNPPRERLAGWREIRRLLRRCDYVTHHPPVSGLQNVAWAFLVGLRTSLRAAEICRLHRDDLAGSVATIRKHKTQHLTGKPRRVPLTPQGARLLRELSAFAEQRGRQELFGIQAASLDAQFRKVTSALMIDDLHFHDSRATALTHMARKMDVLTLAKISGHRDLKVLMRSYYREHPEQIAARLALPIAQRRRHPTSGASG